MKAFYIFLVVTTLMISTASAMDLETLMTRHREALGGERIQEIHSKHALYDISIATFAGTFEEWSRVPGEYRIEFKLPIMSKVQGGDLYRDWTLEGGQTKVEEKKEPSRPSTVLPEFEYLYPGPDLNLEYGGENQHEEKGTEYILIVKEKKDGKWTEQTFYIDAESFLVNRVETEEEGMDVTLHYDSYRNIDGMKVAESSRQVIDFPGATPMVFKLKTCEFNVRLTNELFMPPGESVKDYAFPPGKKMIKAPIKLLDGHIILQVAVNGSENKNFLLDSGAGGTILSKNLTDDLGLKTTPGIQSLGVGGMEQVGFVEYDQIDINGLKLKARKAYCVDFSPLEPFLGMRIDGILGYDLFSRFVIDLNYSDKTITVYETQTFDSEQYEDWTEGRLSMNLFEIPGEFEGHKGWFRLDTGSNGSLHLHAPFVEEHNLLKDRKTFKISALGLGGESDVYVSRTDEFQLAGYEFSNMPVDLITGDKGALSIGKSYGTVGAKILSRFRIIFDYMNNRLRLIPSEKFDDPFKVNKAGLEIMKEDDEFKIFKVYDRTPASKCDLRKGDVIIKVNGKKAEEYGFYDLKELFSAPEDTKIKIQYLRDGKKRKCKFRLKEFF